MDIIISIHGLGWPAGLLHTFGEEEILWGNNHLTLLYFHFNPHQLCASSSDFRDCIILSVNSTSCSLCVYFKSQMINQVSSSPSDNRSWWRQIYGYSIFVLVSANLGKQSPSCCWDESNKSWLFHFLFHLLLKPCLRPCHLLYSWQPEHPVGWNSFKDLLLIFHPFFSLFKKIYFSLLPWCIKTPVNSCVMASEALLGYLFIVSNFQKLEVISKCFHSNEEFDQ